MSRVVSYQGGRQSLQRVRSGARAWSYRIFTMDEANSARCGFSQYFRRLSGGHDDAYDVVWFGNALVAATATGVERSTDYGNTWTTCHAGIQHRQCVHSDGKVYSRYGDAVIVSSDGVSWASAGTLPDSYGTDLVSFGDYLYAHSGIDTVYRSVDGASWTLAGTTPDGNAPRGYVTYDGYLYYVTSSSHVDPTLVRRSANGTSWDTVDTIAAPANLHCGVSFSGMLLFGGSYLMAGPSYLTLIYKSTDGTTFTEVTRDVDAGAVSEFAVAHNRVYAGHAGSALRYSYDGETWHAPHGYNYYASTLCAYGGR